MRNLPRECVDQINGRFRSIRYMTRARNGKNTFNNWIDPRKKIVNLPKELMRKRQFCFNWYFTSWARFLAWKWRYRLNFFFSFFSNKPIQIILRFPWYVLSQTCQKNMYFSLLHICYTIFNKKWSLFYSEIRRKSQIFFQTQVGRLKYDLREWFWVDETAGRKVQSKICT